MSLCASISLASGSCYVCVLKQEFYELLQPYEVAARLAFCLLFRVAQIQFGVHCWSGYRLVHLLLSWKTDTLMATALAAQWHHLTAPLLIDEKRREATFKQLIEAYSASTRHYHTLRHVQILLDAMQAEATIHDSTVVQLAVWFHDAVYDPLRSDNETRSAELASAFLAETTLSESRQRQVACLIERTKDHTQTQPDDDTDLQLFLDADLGILGASEDEYWQYARQVRQEYQLVPDLLYRPGRSKVLEKLLTTPVLYRTAAYRTRLDAAARRNLQAELQAWERGGL